ncbi:MAG: RNA pyrophosphohydrolase [Pseudomonadota bacterium]|nr:RNA pyrophosphohydrolase [Pseudomonadota bacterium]
MDQFDSKGYRSNVGIILTRNDGLLLLGGRLGQSGWQFPQGGIKVGESALDAMHRELREEIGLQPSDIEVLGHSRDWLEYRLPKKYVRRDRIPICIGQKQRWFMLRLINPDAKLQLDLSDMPEFDRWRWVDYWEPVREVIYFKRDVYIAALEELSPLIFFEKTPPRPEWWADLSKS